LNSDDEIDETYIHVNRPASQPLTTTTQDADTTGSRRRDNPVASASSVGSDDYEHVASSGAERPEQFVRKARPHHDDSLLSSDVSSISSSSLGQKQQHHHHQQQKHQHARRRRWTESSSYQLPQRDNSFQQQRQSLHRTTPLLSQYQTTPITKHYDVSKQILAAFDSHYSNNLFVTAYAVGLQFVETALLEIPKHGYFYSKRHERERMESSLEAARVAHLLQEIAVMPGGETATVTIGDVRRVEKLLTLALEQVEQASSDQDEDPDQRRIREVAYESNRARTEQELREDDQEWIITCEPLCLSSSVTERITNIRESVTNVLCPVQERHQEEISTLPAAQQVPAAPSALERGRAVVPGAVAVAEPASARAPPNLTASGNSIPAPPPLLPSRTESGSFQGSMDDLLLEKALFLSGLEVTFETPPGRKVPVSDSGKDEEVAEEKRIPPPGLPPVRVSSTILQLKTLSGLYREDFDSLQQSGRVRVSFADTYQGRVPESTNGCTVIAPLLCIHHLVSGDDEFPDPGLPDAAIEQCIDAETPAILTELRQNLGLSDQAFLIPSDVHDYLLEHGQLSQDQFLTVTGGNVLDYDHLRAFVSAVEKTTHRRIAATLFFHEHVVAILKLRRGDGQSCWYDFLDSMPNKEMLRRATESEQELCLRLGLPQDMDPDLDDDDCIGSSTTIPKTARIRCLDAEALTAVIRWYACSKFTQTNEEYIDQYPWDDSAFDFDPRVFQAFVFKT
jgi:hypothetical protein